MRFWPFGKKNDRPRNEAMDINDPRLWDLLADVAGFTSTAGPMVSPSSAMKFSAVYCCVSLIADNIAALPCEVHRRTTTGSDVAYDHPVHYLLYNEPNPRETAFVWWEAELYNHLLSGNAYGLIARSPIGTPRATYMIPAECVTPRFNDAKTRILYQIHQDTGTTKTFDQDDVLHFPCIGWDGLKGMSPIKAGADAIGLGLAGEEYNARYFTNGIKSDIMIRFPEKLSPEAGKKFREYIKNRYGGPENSHLPLVLTEGGEAKSLAMSAEDAQLIESRDFQIEDICRFYRVPLHMVASTKKTTSWGSGIEEQTIGFVKFTLRPYLKRIEQELNRKLLRSPKFFCKFNLEALLRGDIKTRSEFYKTARGGNQEPGFMTINEIRRKENLPPIDGGDKLYVPITGKSDEEQA